MTLARLVPIDGAPAIEILKDVNLVGRREDCDIFLDHKSVSKMHCVLSVAPEKVFVRDLGSTNGTRVNGARVRRGSLGAGDQLNIASIIFRIEFLNDMPPITADDNTINLPPAGGLKSRSAPQIELPDEGPSDNSIITNDLPDAY